MHLKFLSSNKKNLEDKKIIEERRLKDNRLLLSQSESNKKMYEKEKK